MFFLETENKGPGFFVGAAATYVARSVCRCYNYTRLRSSIRLITNNTLLLCELVLQRSVLLLH